LFVNSFRAADKQQKCRLEYIVRVWSSAEHPTGNPVDHGPMSMKQDGEGGLVASCHKSLKEDSIARIPKRPLVCHPSDVSGNNFEPRVRHRPNLRIGLHHI
jgi:hypothetical protein